MLFNVSQLLKEPIGAKRRYDLVEDLSELDPELKPLNPLVGQVELLRIHSGILVRGELSTAVQRECNRCLEPIVMPVRFQIEENFRPLTEVSTGRYIPPDEFEGDENTLTDEALLINEQHILNLGEVVRQNVWVSVPLYPTCTQAGLDHCQGLEARQEEMRLAHADLYEDGALDADVDPRWAALLELQQNAGSESNEKS